MKRELSQIKRVEPKLRPVSKSSISDEIVNQIMGLIAKGDLKPGQRLPSERELCVRFGTGRSSLREALRCLSIVGVLNARVGEGTSVALNGDKFLGKIFEWRLITEQHDIQNLAEVRVGLEGLAAANAARSGSEEDLRALEILLEKMRASQEDHKRFSALDVEFHIAIAEASGNRLLIDMISMIRGQLARGLSRVLMLPSALPLSYKEHLKIMQKVHRRDPEGAREAMSEHLRAGLERYRQFVKMEANAAAERKLAGKKRTSRKSGAAAIEPEHALS